MARAASIQIDTTATWPICAVSVKLLVTPQVAATRTTHDVPTTQTPRQASFQYALFLFGKSGNLDIGKRSSCASSSSVSDPVTGEYSTGQRAKASLVMVLESS